jgi:hypothetical protein
MSSVRRRPRLASALDDPESTLILDNEDPSTEEDLCERCGVERKNHEKQEQEGKCRKFK